MATAQNANAPGTPEPGWGESRSDAELIAATRSGDTTAYGELYERHVQAAKRLGRILARDAAEADDLVSETFAKLLATLRDGRGPDLAFRAYLLTTLRNTFYDRTRRDKKVEFTDDMTKHDPGEAFIDTAVAGQERRYAARAFHRLPERWQVVLWHTEVEGDSAADIAPLLGLTPNGVSALAYRARERLRQMYLQEHIQDSPAATCRWTADRLGARVRGGLSNRDSGKVDVHLTECAACKLLLLELTEVNSGMRDVLAPLVLGLAAPAYLGGTAVKGAVVAGWFGGMFGGIAEAGRQTVGWVRRIGQQIGGRGAAVAGTATVIIAAVLALVMVANNTSPPPEPPPVAAPQEETPEDPADDPQDPPPTDDPQDPPPDEPTDTPSGETPEEEPPAEEPESPEDYDIVADPTAATLVAGDSGSLPVYLKAPEFADFRVSPTPRRETARVEEAGFQPMRTRAKEPERPLSLTLALPKGISTPGGDAGDGWVCEAGDQKALCTRAALASGEDTVANIPLDIIPEVTGFHDITASVDGKHISGESKLRIPVAPAGTQVAYASQEATGLASAGNTLLICKPGKICKHGLADNHLSLMSSYLAKPGAPQPPSGLDKHTAVSGAQLSIPAGSEILWAGLYWANSGKKSPPPIQFATPGGGWRQVSEQRHWSGHERPIQQSAADITDMISGSGEYWVAAEASSLPTGPMHYAGWGITVVYRQSGAAEKETAIYEGLSQPRAGAELSVSLPKGGDIDVTYTLWDGDRTLYGDELTVGGTTLGDSGNLGHSYSPSALEGDDWHTFGVDVAVCSTSTGSAATQATISTGNDPLEIAVFGLAAPPP